LFHLNQRLLFTLNSLYIGIDLAWGEKNYSGFCVAKKDANKLKILELKLLKSIDEILQEILKYKEHKIYVGVDAPLVVPNEEGNREIEKEFNKEFAKYKISMLPANKKLLSKYSPNIRSIELYERLSSEGFERDYKSDRVLFEVYTHSTIAMCFHNHCILPYKRKKGRNTEFIKEQLQTYQNYLLKEFRSHSVLKQDLEQLKGQKVKDYEDMLDAITCAYSIWYCKNNDAKFYKVDGIDTFVTPISKWKVYVLECNDGSLYTGVATDLERRVDEHNTSNKGAKYTKVRRPVKLVYYENCADRVDACKREYAIKHLSRAEKLELINV
jgi:predicted GIY-YIG superfamily endonuclease/predicted RNase H-like nuclease